MFYFEEVIPKRTFTMWTWYAAEWLQNWQDYLVMFHVTFGDFLCHSLNHTIQHLLYACSECPESFHSNVTAQFCSFSIFLCLEWPWIFFRTNSRSITNGCLLEDRTKHLSVCLLLRYTVQRCRWDICRCIRESEHLLLTSVFQMFLLIYLRVNRFLGICGAAIALLLQYVTD